MLGANSRLDEIQAAFLRVKLRYLDKFINHKRKLANIYFNQLPDDLSLPIREKNSFDTFHIFSIRHKNRNKLREILLDKGVRTEIHYPIPPHKQLAMKNILKGTWPISEEHHSTQLSLPISYGHNEDDIHKVCKIISKIEFDF